ncbi:MAG TPA: hypothetical protein VN222_07340, partial [Novosphingobium sp.]|nr:hypothetical protein [Novosphingobium sp.]
ASFAATLRAQVRRVRAALGQDIPILLIAPPDAATRNPAVAHPLSTDMHGCARGLMIPSGLAAVRREEWSSARALGLAFWNAGLAMGGPCTSLDWGAQGMMIGDLVHLTKSGGAVVGALLAADLEGAAASGPAPAYAPYTGYRGPAR